MLMRTFAGILRHEISMSLRRKGLWIAYGLLFVFHTVLLFTPPPIGEMVKGEVIAKREVWQVAGRFLLACNVFFLVVAGILSADRVRRDFRLGLRELQDSTPLSRPVYVLAKYLGSLASSLFPLFLWVMGIAAFMALIGRAHASMLYAVPVAFLAITVPAFAFVVAFSLACPMVMPGGAVRLRDHPERTLTMTSCDRNSNGSRRTSTTAPACFPRYPGQRRA
jgi:ABC-type transport system involved in multi-copper enzyme maturation permease subunit